MYNREFSNKLDTFFNTLNIKTINNINVNISDNIICNFINGPFVEILGNSNTKYTVRFIDTDTNTIVHEGTIFPNHWIRANRIWYTNWKIEIYTNELVYEHIFNVKNKKVYVHISSQSIGDTLAWFPYIEEFRKLHGCQMVCSTFHNYLFDGKYNDIKFIEPGTQVYDLYAMYEIGIYEDNFNRNKNDHKKIPLQQVSSDMLGINFIEIRPDINIKKSYKNSIRKKYVALTTESTAQCKLWNNVNGWQKIVDYLHSIGYEVVVVQKSKSSLKNVIHKTENDNLMIAVDIINNAEFFIGLSSGLSWISWALQKKTILISGFTEPWYEFNENCYRIFNKHVCKGCWHTDTFDKGKWNWCPRNNNFECTSTISVDDVINQIQIIENNSDLMYTHNSIDKKINLTNSIIGFQLGKRGYEDASIMFYEIFRDKSYNFGDCRINENDVVVDIGANIGVFSRYAIVNGASKIYSFEPIKENYDILCKNLTEYSDIVKTYNIAINDINGTDMFHIDSTTGGHTILDIDPNKSRTGELRSINCFTLDYIMDRENISNIDFLKIDTEGAEYAILQGISDTNLQKINKICIEWHDFLFNNNDELISSVLNRMSLLGFRVYRDHMGPQLSILYFWK